MKKSETGAVNARLNRNEILNEGARLASSIDSNGNLGIPPWRPDGWETSVSGKISVKVQGGRYVLCSPLAGQEPIPVSSDFVFALGSLLGFFEPFDGGRDVDGSRLVYTRAYLLQKTFGPRWERYARAYIEVDAARGAPLRIVGLPQSCKVRALTEDSNIPKGSQP